ncbi:MAG: hypothetical protein JWP97_2906 [Labilithrix sp.]|nr:hypothetical protein [Labilithrix sp.]
MVETFEQLAALADPDVDVELGAMLIARDAYGTVDVAEALAELHALGRDAGHPDPEATLRARVERVSEEFQKLGFRGNAEDYYDPRNSFLTDVVRRRTGIPITLCIVWRAMARAASLDAEGVSFPAHFLVRVDGPRGGPRLRRPIIVDPFNGGRILDLKAARALHEKNFGASGMPFDTDFFMPANPRITIMRMLVNLQNLYTRRGEDARAFLAVDRILTLLPNYSIALRDRAALATRLGAHEVARADLERVLQVEPDCADGPLILSRLAKLGPPAKVTLH